MAVLVVNTWAEKNDKERDDKRGVSTANRPLLLWQADDKGRHCEEYVNSEEGVIIEEAVCPGDCDAQLVFERCRGRQEERNSREEGLD
jgi:hypothetical protein